MKYISQDWYERMRAIALEVNAADVEKRLAAAYGMGAEKVRELGKSASFGLMYGMQRGIRVHDSVIIDDIADEPKQHSTAPTGSRLVRALIRRTHEVR